MTTTKTKPKVKEEEVIEEATADKPKVYSAKDLAAECGTDPKTFRRWLRSTTDRRANKGGRWEFTEAQRADYLQKYAERSKGTQPTNAEG